MAPIVSVVIPTFNRSTLLINAIESVLAQTYKDYEIIVIDDGSTDDTREKLRPYMERVRYFYQDNRGASAAQNKGIGVARGKWVSILASDDVWLPTKLENQLRAIATLGDEFGACFTDCIYAGNPELKLSAFQQAGLNIRTEFGPLEDPTKYILGKYLPFFVQSLLVMRSLLEELGGFDEAMVLGEDVDLIFRLAFKTRFCLVSAPLVRIDQTPSRPRLTELYSHTSNQVFASIEYRYRKWLALPQLLDPGTRQTIHESLRLLYYGWTIARLKRRELAVALEKMSDITQMGDNYATILFVLLSRAARKVARALRKPYSSFRGRRTACN